MRRRRILGLMAILGLVHAYVGWRLLPDLPVALGVRVAGAAGLASSFALMIAGLNARAIRDRAWSDAIAAAGLTATGLLSSLFVLTVLRDLLLLALIFPLSAQAFQLVESFSAAAAAALALFVTGVGFANARRRAGIVNVEIPVANLPAALDGFTIAQVSDVHVGRTIKRNYVDAVVRAVNELDADLIAVTGDLVDGPVEELAEHVAPLAALESRHGVFFVTGNHEYYCGEAAWRTELGRLGLKVLMNEHVVLTHRGARIVVAGVTDFGAERFDATQKSDPEAALRGAPRDVGARVLLAHQPRSAPAAARAGFDVQLSGHTHGGQFWPWMLFVRLQQPFTAGLNRLERLWVYTSRGTGYWGPPKRFCAPSEITLLRLVPAATRTAGTRIRAASPRALRARESAT
jgi:uncharacterized protein